MPNPYHLILIETSGNQRHIFETNKLAENVGASEQIFRLGTDEVLKVAREVGGLTDLMSLEDVNDLAKNPPLENSDKNCEAWYVSSGKAMLFVREFSLAREIVQAITLKAHLDYPGVVVRGAIVRVECDDDPKRAVLQLAEAVKKVHDKLEAKRSQLAPNECRFQRLPIVAECQMSGLPAGGIVKVPGETIVSTIVAAKRGGFHKSTQHKWREGINKRLNEIFAGDESVLLARNVDELDDLLEDARYLAIIHADGNGIGQIFQNFDRLCDAKDLRDFIVKLRAFSYGIDQCTKAAFKEAVHVLCKTDGKFAKAMSGQQKHHIPLLPLILGGDDCTVLTTAEFGIPLVREFLRQFESQCENYRSTDSQLTEEYQQIVAKIAEQQFGVRRLGMAAGVAIVKPHYPFYAAYEMAEGLIRSVKSGIKKNLKVKVGSEDVPLPVTAYDFHVHHASSGDSIKTIRDSMALEITRKTANKIGSEERNQSTRTRFWGGPYVLTANLEQEERLQNQAAALDWTNPRMDARLWEKVNALQSVDATSEAGNNGGQDVRTLPNSQMHELRTALLKGKKPADHLLELIGHRYQSSHIQILKEENSLFRNDPPEDDPVTRISYEVMSTSLYDAMSLAHLKIQDGKVETT
ncbi:Cas10/Cmr2 second palm domain-containing protein [Rubinisphaera italica]|uniref:Cas10/Cmr2 second palm domain-containing protein n=1 Tax=Rubinisphaera italica TaxID=2527969 RepID=A0A5C5XLB4_9PLAN|nr:hypothetical protein [Rubinisphaera italica]TWT63730.1 hypothetical protein Pan54_44880 [Rubinisphaera italica]